MVSKRNFPSRITKRSAEYKACIKEIKVKDTNERNERRRRKQIKFKLGTVVQFL